MTQIDKEAVERLAQKVRDRAGGFPDANVFDDAETTLRALRAALDAAEAEIEKLRERNRQMVEKAASGGTLDGYREMGAKLAAAEAEKRAAYKEGWRFAYRQWERTGSVPDPEYVPHNAAIRKDK